MKKKTRLTWRQRRKRVWRLYAPVWAFIDRYIDIHEKRKIENFSFPFPWELAEMSDEERMRIEQVKHEKTKRWAKEDKILEAEAKKIKVKYERKKRCI